MNMLSDRLKSMGYTEEALEKDNPYSQQLLSELADLPIVKNPLVIYHSNCADGFSAAWVFHQAQLEQGHSYDFHAGVYSESPPDCTDRVVYLVDFSYKREVVRELCKVATKVILIDHHKTAMEDLAGLEHECNNFSAYTSLHNSGATLAWDYWYADKSKCSDQKDCFDIVYSKDPPLLLGHIEDRDLWKFKLPNTREISAAVFSYEYTFENWDKLMGSDQVELLKLSVAGAAIERKHHKDIAELVKITKRLAIIGGTVVPIASMPYTYSSDAGQLMATEYENGTKFACCYWDTGTHRVFSLRSTTNGMDVSEVAKRYGGGGHSRAAGFSVPRDHDLAGI